MKYPASHIISLLVLIMLLLPCSPLLAKHSDGFLLGNYSYIKNSFPFFSQNRKELLNAMHELGYNSSVIETDSADPDLSGLLASMDSLGIDAWITDRGWDNNPNSQYRYALTPLSTSSYQRFEAELFNEKSVKKGDEDDYSLWYAFRNDNRIKRTGKAATNKAASYGYVWKVQRGKNKAGYVLSDLRYRWPNVNGDYIKCGKEFHLYQKNPPTHDDNYIYLKYRLKVSNVQPDLPPETPLFSLQVVGFELSGGGYSKEEKILPQKYGDNTWRETIFTFKDYLVQKSAGDFFNLEIKISYVDLLAANILTADLDGNPTTWPSAYLMKVSNLNPRIYWQGNCDMEVDYVELEDQIHHELVNNPNYWSRGIYNRATNIIAAGKGNVSGFYTFDEPYQGQFDSYGIMQNMFNDWGLELFTATYDYQYDNVIQNKRGPQYYDHLYGFRKHVQPIILANDIYPIKPNVLYNYSTKERQHFIQNVLDKKLIPVYKTGKEYCLEDTNRKFYPIVQVFGSWSKNADKGNWTSWSLPPQATQKTLLYLPLCYGADGIMHYRLQGFHTLDGYGDYAAMFSLQDGKNYLPPDVDKPIWSLLASTNPKVKTYGAIIKGLDWKGAETVMLKDIKDKKLKKAALLKSVMTKKTRRGDYEGYIQLGVYQDADDNPYLMVVNRRGNYFKPDKITQERFVPPSEYEKYYPEAEPQTLVIKLDREAIQRFGNSVALFDSSDNQLYPSSKGIIEIPLNAGEGRLLQMVRASQ